VSSLAGLGTIFI